MKGIRDPRNSLTDTWKIQAASRGSRAYDLCDAGAIRLYQLSYVSIQLEAGQFVVLSDVGRGPFLESPETLRAIFGCHNSLCNSRTESI